MYTLSGSTSNSKEAFCMVYHTFWGDFNRHFLYRVAGDGFKTRYAFLIRTTESHIENQDLTTFKSSVDTKLSSRSIPGIIIHYYKT